MKGAYEQYLNVDQDLLSKIEKEQIEKAAYLLVYTLKSDELIYGNR